MKNKISEQRKQKQTQIQRINRWCPGGWGFGNQDSVVSVEEHTHKENGGPRKRNRNMLN